jgi:hypothetical protein
MGLMENTMNKFNNNRCVPVLLDWYHSGTRSVPGLSVIITRPYQRTRVFLILVAIILYIHIYIPTDVIGESTGTLVRAILSTT